MNWHGPVTVDELLDQTTLPSPLMPPDADGVYIVSLKSWRGEPTLDCEPLYVGGNTGKSARFRTRMGDLLADLFGFFGSATGHSSGGQSLHKFCREKGIRPKKLYIGWAANCICGRCGEVEMYARRF
jgi:hypothetical protein